MTPPTAQAVVPWWREPTRGQWVTFLAAWLGWVLDGFDFTIFLLTMPLIAAEFGVGPTAVAGSITLTLLVRLAGGVLAGVAADRWGRKLPLMVSIAWFALCDGAVAFAPSFTWVLVLRTLFGFGMGAEWTAGSTLAMEGWPQRSRGLASGVLQGSWALGFLLAAQVSAVVVPAWGWRALFLLAAAPALLVIPIRLWVPESAEHARHAGSKETRSWRSLARPPTPRRLAWGSAVLALGFGGYYGLSSLYPTMLAKEAGLGLASAAPLVSLFNVGMMAGAVTWGVVAVRRGPVVAIMLPAALALLAIPLHVGLVGGALGAGAFLAGALGAGHSGVTPLLLTSLFPAPVRARAVGLVYHLGASVAAVVPTLVAALHEHGGLRLSVSMAVVSASCLVGLVAFLAAVPAGDAPPAR
jgi:SHS family lactate transporter-like MFS transporter